MTTTKEKSQTIHPSAVVEPGAQLGYGVTVEPYAIIKSDVVLNDHVTIKAHAYIDGCTEIGERTTIYPFASIGTKTQDLKYRGEKTYVRIGQGCEIREFVTINSSCGDETSVDIGNECLIMAYCHIAHNSHLGNRVIMSNNATLAGHVTIEDNAILGGLTPVHQFVRIGRYAMVGGLSRVTHDVPPYTIGAGVPFKYGGLNIVGLKRYGFPLETRQILTRAFKIMFRSHLHHEEALRKIEAELEPIPEIRYWLDFCRNTKRGILGAQGVAQGK